MKFARLGPGLGLERLGLLSSRWPAPALLIALLLSALSVWAATGLSFNADLDGSFKADSPAYRTYADLRKTFGDSENDIIVLVTGKDLTKTNNLNRLRRLHLELAFLDGVERVTSLFSARRPIDRTGYAAPVVPAELGQADLSALRAQLHKHPLVGGLLLSKDNRLAIFVVRLEQDATPELDDLRNVLAQIRSIAAKELGPALSIQVTGLPVMRVSIIAALVRNQVLFVISAFLLGLLLSAFFLGSVRDTLVAGVPAGLAAAMVFGVARLLDQPVDGLTVLVPTLVIVLTLADSLHLMFAARRQVRREAASTGPRYSKRAVDMAVLRVGPACVLTSATTALALLSLIFVDKEMVRGFARTAAVGVLLSYVVSLGVTPALLRLLPGTPPSGKRQRLNLRLAEGCTRLGALLQARPLPVAIALILVLVAAGSTYIVNTPRYIYRDFLPEQTEAARALRKIDRDLSGAATIRVVLQVPDGVALNSAKALQTMSLVHKAIQALPQISKTVSLASAGPPDAAGNGAYSAAAWQAITRRLQGVLYDTKRRQFLITGHLRDRDVPGVMRALPALRRDLNRLVTSSNALGPSAKVSITGVYLVATATIHGMIGDLSWSLLLSIVVILAAIAVMLRSFRAGLFSLAPNLFPLAVGSAWLYLTGVGLQFTSVVAFVVGFGIAVDSTIHLLVRHRAIRSSKAASRALMSKTLGTVGPVIVITTLVLMVGAATTMFSDMNTISLFGEVSLVILLAALVGDLLLLPALLVLAGPRLRPPAP